MNTENKLKDGDGSDASTCSAYRVLDNDELPKQGDEAWHNRRWQKVEVPSMWLAGGQRIEGSIFRRPMIKPNVKEQPPALTRCTNKK